MKSSGKLDSARKFPMLIVWIVLSLFTLFPIYWMFVISARSRVELFGAPSIIQTSFYAENYIRPLVRDVFGRYILNSVLISSGNTVLVLICAIHATYAMSRYTVKGDQNIFFWMITNRMAPPAAFLIPLYLLYTRVMRIGDFWLYDTRVGMILVYCIINLPFSIWLLKGIIDGIPIDIDEAARVDGASTLGIIWRIIVPLAAPGIAITALLSWIFAWNEYLIAATLTSVSARTITTGLAEFVTVVGTNWGEMAAVSMICILPALVFLALVQKYIVAGLTFGSIRE